MNVFYSVCVDIHTSMEQDDSLAFSIGTKTVSVNSAAVAGSLLNVNRAQFMV